MAFAAANAPSYTPPPSWVLSGQEIYYLPGKPATTYEAGNKVYRALSGNVTDAGLFLEATDSTPRAYFEVVKTVTTPASTTCGFPRGFNSLNPTRMNNDTNAANTLVPCRLMVGGGARVTLMPFSTTVFDDAVSAYSSVSLTLTTSPGADDDPNGGFVYIYSGPGAGQWNQIIDYAHSTAIATLARIFDVAPTSASNVILAENASGAGGAACFGKCDLSAVGTLGLNDGADDGDYVIVCDALQLPYYISRGCLPVASVAQLGLLPV